MAPLIYKFGRVVMVALIVTAATLFQTSQATIYRVGDTNGWKVPDGYSYSDWAQQHTFVVGDILEFDFLSGEHTVTSVSFDDYNNCNTFSPLNVQTFSPANFTLSLGSSYFICVVNDDCLHGQKLAVNVSSYVQPGLGSPPNFPYGSPFPFGAPVGNGNGNRPPPFGNASPYYGLLNSATTIPATTCGGSLLFLFVAMAFLF